VIDNEYDCDVYLSSEKYLGNAQAKWQSSKTVWPQPLKFVHECIRKGVFRLTAPPLKNLPGRKPGAVRSAVLVTLDWS
jgi:hypothetical protein